MAPFLFEEGKKAHAAAPGALFIVKTKRARDERRERQPH